MGFQRPRPALERLPQLREWLARPETQDAIRDALDELFDKLKRASASPGV